jgi:perosamine synthetase
MVLKIPYLIPRLNYRTSLQDFLNSVRGIFKSRIIPGSLKLLFNSEDIFFTNQARTGLRIVLNSLGLSEGARIGVQVYNCRTVFQAVKNADFVPVFIDISDDFRIDTQDLERKKDEIDALIVTHTFGIPADMDTIKRIVPGIPIIEDCAHAFLTRYKNRPAGMFGDAAIFSIGKAKFPSVGSGGVILVNNKSFLEGVGTELSKLRTPGLIDELSSVIKSPLMALLHNPFIYSLFTHRLLKSGKKENGSESWEGFSELKILRSNLHLFSRFLLVSDIRVSRQRSNLKEFLTRLTDCLPGVSFEIFHESSLFINGFMIPFLSANREEVIRFFREQGVEAGKHFSKSIEWATEFGYYSGSCRNGERICSLILTIPCYYSLSDKEVRRISKSIEKFKI